MKRLLTVVIAALSVGAVTASAQLNFSLDTDAEDTLLFTGLWDLQPFENQIVDGDYWALSFDGTRELRDDVPFYVLSVRAEHTVGAQALSFAASLGSTDLAEGQGSIGGALPHAWGVDRYEFKANFNTQGQMQIEVSGAHTVPEPGVLAMIVLGLVGFTTHRRRA